MNKFNKYWLLDDTNIVSSKPLLFNFTYTQELLPILNVKKEPYAKIIIIYPFHRVENEYYYEDLLTPEYIDILNKNNMIGENGGIYCGVPIGHIKKNNIKFFGLQQHSIEYLLEKSRHKYKLKNMNVTII